MGEQDYTFFEDLKETRAMIDGLERYLEGSELYGRVGSGGIFGGGRMPSLTVGALVMRLRRLHVLYDQLKPDQQQQLDALIEKHAAIRKEWRQHYERKMLREANSRLDAMRTFFQEAAESPQTAFSIYRPELLRRTIVQELLIAMDEMGIESEDISSKARQTDARLNTTAPERTDFLWSHTLEPAYPRTTFWWLYQKPRETR